MSTFTENYNLIKPYEDDYYDVADFNENMDVIDTQLAKYEGINEKIGESTDDTTETVFGKLNAINNAVDQGASFIKSIQKVSFSISASSGSGNQSIEPVIPSRCVVLLDRLCDESTWNSNVSYTLTENTLSVSAKCGISGTLNLLFQIIEFY